MIFVALVLLIFSLRKYPSFAELPVLYQHENFFSQHNLILVAWSSGMAFNSCCL